MISGYDGRLYGISFSSIFAYTPATNQFESVAGLQQGVGYYINSLGSSIWYAHLLETCTKPYFFFTIPDTVHVFQGQPVSFGLGTPNTDTFRWYKDNIYQATQTDSLLHITAAAFADQGWYHTKLTNECGDSITKKFYLKVDVVTPLGLVFSGRVKGSSALLQWQVSSAANTSYYELQRSPNSRNFVPIAKINATTQTTYTYTDEGIFDSPSSSERERVRFSYRLKEVAKDGKESYSNVVCLLTTANSLLTITPNPAKNKLTISFRKLIRGVVKFDLIAANGQPILSKQAKNIEIETIAVGNLPTGVYTLQITTGEGTETRKVVVER